MTTIRDPFLLRLCCRSSGSRLKQFRWYYLRLVLFLFAVNSVLQSSALIFDRDLSGVGLSDFDVGVEHGIGRALSLDLIDHVVVGESQVFGQRAALA